MVQLSHTCYSLKCPATACGSFQKTDVTALACLRQLYPVEAGNPLRKPSAVTRMIAYIQTV